MAERGTSNHRNILRSLLLCSLTLPALPGSIAHCQNAEETARQIIRLKAYGMYSYVDPRYGDVRNNGFTIGTNIDGYRLLPRTELGVDIRYMYDRGLVTNQSYLGGGLRLSARLAAFRPYVDVLYGQGRGTFNLSNDPNYKKDNTGALDFGGGMDYQFSRSWGVRADVQRQNWQYSVRQPSFNPMSASIGLVYQFHFHGRTGPNL